VRRSGQNKTGATRRSTWFAAGQRPVLDQVKVAEKSNEIVAIPKLLEMLAMGQSS
jgi:hypothetical protein